jgi:hypothetical protein
MFERGPALTSTIGVGSYHLDRIRMKLPRTSVQGFERPGRSLYGLRRAFRITDINSLLQALEWVASELSRVLKKLTWYADMARPPYLPPTYSQYGERRG